MPVSLSSSSNSIIHNNSNNNSKTKEFWMIHNRHRRHAEAFSLPTVAMVDLPAVVWNDTTRMEKDGFPSTIPEAIIDDDDDEDEDVSTNSSNSSGEEAVEGLIGNHSSSSSSTHSIVLSPKPKLKTKKKKKKHLSSSKWRQPVDIESYMTRREMTKTQERWNALTMVPYPAYCLYFLLSAQWFVRQDDDDGLTVETARSVLSSLPTLTTILPTSLLIGTKMDDYGCLSPTWWHSMPCLPPTPVVAVALGITAHAPFSFVYHWCYAHTLPPVARSKHWSRRMDQALIHIGSICACCGTATSLSYIVANAIFNMDCAIQHFRSDVKPRRNQLRCGLSLLFYTAPLLYRDPTLFWKMWMVFATSIWFFVAYPVGGWSHAIFHLIMALGPPLTFQAAVGISDTRLAQFCWMEHQQQQ
jgi:hypothetical protein